MRISIHGLGYVGSVSLACFAQSGHTLIGVDINQNKVELINRGESPVVERDLGKIIREQRRRRNISATLDAEAAALDTDVSFICAGTPSQKNGHLNLSAILGVAEGIAGAIAKKAGYHVVVVRSTVMPGTNQDVASLIERVSGKRSGRDFAVVSNPEFLREGTAVSDFVHPPYTLVGTSDDRAFKIMEEVYGPIDAPILRVEPKLAELIKYVNNSFHALKICFANEVGSICSALDIDSIRLMDVFCQDTKLNVSRAYLKPGFAYGGSCLPKDLRALCTVARDHYLKCPVLENIEPSNDTHKGRILDRILEFGKQKIGFLGLSFKEGTDDLRSSPIVDILEKLLGKGYDIKIYDRNINLAKLIGGNREFILKRIPFISRFLVDDAEAVVAHSDVLVIVNNEAGFKEGLRKVPRDKIVLDLVDLDFPGRKKLPNYHGASW